MSIADVGRATALSRVVVLYLLVQLLSYLALQASCSPYALGDLWLHGALGPLAAVEAVPGFQYHSVLENAAFVLVCLLVLAAPFAYVMRPRLATLVLSGLAVVVWWLFGLGFSIDHM